MNKFGVDNIVSGHFLLDSAENGTSMLFVPLNPAMGLGMESLSDSRKQKLGEYVAMYYFRKNTITAKSITKVYISRKEKARENWNKKVNETGVSVTSFEKAFLGGSLTQELVAEDTEGIAGAMYDILLKKVVDMMAYRPAVVRYNRS